MIFDKSIKELMFSEHISYKTTKNICATYIQRSHGIVQDGTEYCIARK